MSESADASEADVVRGSEVVVIGAGMTGLTVAAMLRRAGLFDFVVVDEADGVGGTWRDHAYPGVCADNTVYDYVPSFLLHSYAHLFECDVASREELLAFVDAVSVVEVGAERLRLRTRVESHDFDTRRERHRLSAVEIDDRGCERRVVHECRFVFLCTSLLLSKKYVNLPRDLDASRHPCVHHSSELASDPRRYADKDVVILGWGATTTQLAPSLHEVAKSVTIVARTIPLLLPAEKRPMVRERWRQLLRSHWTSKFLTHAIGHFDNRLPHEWLLRAYFGDAIERTRRATRDAYDRRTPISCTRINLDYLGLGSLLADGRVRLVSIDADERVRCTGEGLVVGEREELRADLIVAATGYREFQLDFPFRVDGRVVCDRLEHDGGAPRSYHSMLYDVPNLFVPCLEPALINVPGAVVENIMPLFLTIMEHCRVYDASVTVRDHADEYERTFAAATAHILQSPHCRARRYRARVFTDASGRAFSFANHAVRSYVFDPSDYRFVRRGVAVRVAAIQTTRARVAAAIVRAAKRARHALSVSIVVAIALLRRRRWWAA